MGALAICQPTKARAPRARLYGLPTVDDPSLKARTIQQNRALWGCAYKALEESTGHDKAELHTFFCGEYWGWQVVVVAGQRTRRPMRTTTTGYGGEPDVIDTCELGRFYAFLQRRAGVVGFNVPEPDPALRRTWVGESAMAVLPC